MAKKLKCRKCRSTNIIVQTVTETNEVKKKGCGYWLFIGWWLEPLEILLFGVLKLLHIAVGRHTKIVSKPVTYATCQNCGHRWEIDN